MSTVQIASSAMPRVFAIPRETWIVIALLVAAFIVCAVPASFYAPVSPADVLVAP